MLLDLMSGMNLGWSRVYLLKIFSDLCLLVRQQVLKECKGQNLVFGDKDQEFLKINIKK